MIYTVNKIYTYDIVLYCSIILYYINQYKTIIHFISYKRYFII